MLNRKRLGATASFSTPSVVDWTQIHLALNHIPVVGIPILLVLLIVGWWRQSNEVIRLILWALVAISVIAIAMKFTGEFAAERSAQRLVPAQNFVTRHEEAGDQATTGVFFLGLSAALALVLSRQGRPVRPWTLVLVLLLGLLAELLYARAAHRGGEIGHPTLRSKS